MEDVTAYQHPLPLATRRCFQNSAWSQRLGLGVENDPYDMHRPPLDFRWSLDTYVMQRPQVESIGDGATMSRVWQPATGTRPPAPARYHRWPW